MSDFDSLLTVIDNANSTQEPASIVDFPYQGQNYQIDTSNFASEQDAIDAFLQGQNEPVNITPTDVQGTDVQIQPAVAEPDVQIQSPEDIAKEDKDVLSVAELIKGRGDTFAGAANTKVAGIAESFADLPDAVAPFLPPLGQALVGLSKDAKKKGIVEDLKRRGNELSRAGQEAKPDNAVGAFVTDVADASLNMIPSIMTSLALKSPNLGLAEMGVEVFGQSYSAAKDKGEDSVTAAYEAARQVLWEVGPEKAFGFFNRLPGSKGVKDWFKLALREGGSEIVTSGLEQGDETLLQGVPWKGWIAAIKRALKEGSIGAFVGGVIAGPTAFRSTDTQDLLSTPPEEGRTSFLEGTQPDVSRVENINRQGINKIPAVVDRITQNVQEQQARVGTNVQEQNARITSADAAFSDVGGGDDGNARFNRIRQEIVNELGLAPADVNGALSSEDITRLANLRADSRDAGEQLNLNLEDQALRGQEKLNLQRDTSPIQRDLLSLESRVPASAADNVSSLEARQIEQDAQTQKVDGTVIDASLRFGDNTTQLTEADSAKIQEDAQVRALRSEIDAAEQAGMDTSQLQTDLQARETAAQDVTAQQQPVQELGPRAVPTDPQGQLALRDQAPIVPTDQAALPLEGGGEGGGGIQGPVPPGPTGPSRTAPIRGGDALNALARVAESNSIVGDPNIITINEDGSAIGIDGRTIKNPNKGAAAKSLNVIPVKARVYVDLARNLSVASLRTTKELFRSIGAQGRQLATRTTNTIARMESLYKAQSGKPLSKASEADKKLINKYMHGLIGRSIVKSETKLSDDFIDQLDKARNDIGQMTNVMVAENMLPGELRLTLAENADAYIHVTYAANALRQQGTGTAEILDSIPSSVRDQWVSAFQDVYIDPIKAGTLADMTTMQLRRMAKSLRLAERREVIDKQTGDIQDQEIIPGSPNTVEKMTRNDLLGVLSKQSMSQQEITEAIGTVLRSINGNLAGSGRGRDRSIERRRTLARTSEQLKKAGYSEKEIKLNEATRELLMETVDPITNIGTTMSKMMNTIMAHRVINNMAKLEDAGMVSLGKPDSAKGLTELLVPEGHPLGDVRVPLNKNGSDFIFASTQSTGTRDGIFVQPETARMFQYLMDVKPGNSVGNFLRWTAVLSKTNLTALNPRSHTRNAWSAGLIGFIRGHWFTDSKTMVSAVDTASRTVARDFARRNDRQGNNITPTQDALDVILEYATGLGIFNDSTRTGAVKELLTKALTEKDAQASLTGTTSMDWAGLPIEEQLAKVASGGRNVVVRSASKLLELPMAAFRLEDEGMKLFAFMIERRRYAGLTNNKEVLDIIDGVTDNPTPQQLDKVRAFDKGIAKHITDIYPTYSRVPTWVRFLSRNIWVGPFPSFNAEMWRNGLNDWKDLYDLRFQKNRYEGVDSSKAKALYDRRLAAKVIYNTATATVAGIVGLAGMTALGLDPTDDDLKEAYLASQKAVGGKKVDANAIDMSLRSLTPTYIGDSWFQVMNFVPGEKVTLRNLAFTLPNSQMGEFGTNFFASVEAMMIDGDYERASEALLAGTIGLADDYLKQDVLFSAITEATEGVTATGFRIWDPRTDTPAEKNWKRAKYIASVAFPGSRVLKEGQTFADAFKDGKGVKEMSEFVFGINDVDYRLDSLYVSKIIQAKVSPTGINANTTEINRLIANNKEMSDSEFVSKYLKLEEKRRDAFYKLSRLTNAGESLGLTRKQMQRALDAEDVGNFGGMDLRDMQIERYRPYKPVRDNIYDRFRPERKMLLSPEEKEAAFREFKPTLRHRLRIVKRLRQQVKAGDYRYDGS